MRRREFLRTAAGSAVCIAFGALGRASATEENVAASTLPPSPSSTSNAYDCSCGLIRFERQPGGYYAATHFKDGRKISFGLFMWHQRLHEQSAKASRG